MGSVTAFHYLSVAVMLILQIMSSEVEGVKWQQEEARMSSMKPANRNAQIALQQVEPTLRQAFNYEYSIGQLRLISYRTLSPATYFMKVLVKAEAPTINRPNNGKMIPDWYLHIRVLAKPGQTAVLEGIELHRNLADPIWYTFQMIPSYFPRTTGMSPLTPADQTAKTVAEGIKQAVQSVLGSTLTQYTPISYRTEMANIGELWWMKILVKTEAGQQPQYIHTFSIKELNTLRGMELHRLRNDQIWHVYSWKTSPDNLSNLPE